MIALIQSEKDITECAELMISSQPWIRLGTTMEEAAAVLNDPDNETYIYIVGSGLAGFVTYTMKGSLPGYIKRIAVKEAYRSMGIGEKLMQFVEQKILPLTNNIFLCVSDFNTGAISFYERHGYVKIGEIKDYVISGSSEYIMRKTTNPLK